MISNFANTALIIFSLISCGSVAESAQPLEGVTMQIKNGQMKKLEQATFGAGCFWCVEAIFESLDGVEAVRSGYTGGQLKNPTYKEVCSGKTGHAEVVQIDFDSDIIQFEELLEVFWKTHDPTTLNQQGADVGTQYRSAIFFHTEEQKQVAEAYKQQLNKSGSFKNPIVTTLEEFTVLYPAEDYHQDYFSNNPNQPYCQMVVAPKVEKFKKLFHDKLK